MDIRGRNAIKPSLLALAVAAAGLLGSVRSANADTFNFSPTGTGTVYSTSGLSFGAGNALANQVTPGALAVGTEFQVYFQTHLTGLEGLPPGPITGTLTGLNQTYQITEVATLRETVTSVNTTAAGTTVTFALTPGGADQIKLYYNPSVIFDNAAGTGFTTGTVIATLTPTQYISSQFTNSSTTAGGPNANVGFNQTGPNGTPGPGNNSGTGQANTGSGSTNLLNSVAGGPGVGYNITFFQPPSGTPALLSSIFNSNLNSVFDAVNPSLKFTNPITSATILPNVGLVNGQGEAAGNGGTDTQFQVSGFTQSFAVVPEPASVTLMGLGVVGALVVVRRKRANVA